MSPFAGSILGIAEALVDPVLAIVLLGAERCLSDWCEALNCREFLGRRVRNCAVVLFLRCVGGEGEGSGGDSGLLCGREYAFH
jgi:hypothetical protein